MKHLNPCRYALLALTAVLLCGGCGDDATEPEPQGPANLPPVPVPTSVNQLMPAESPSIEVGLSNGLEWFHPVVTSLQMMTDNGSLATSSPNRRLTLACPATLPVMSAQDGAVDASILSARPRLLHKRHWRRVMQSTLSPGTGNSFTETVGWGASTYHEENRSFSTTIGVETSVGGSWEGFSASVTASYSQTETYQEIRSVTFSTESTEERSYWVDAPASGTRVYVLWQLVDVFLMVDASGVPIHESPTLTHAAIQAIPDLEFPNQTVVVLKTTDFPD